MMEMCPLYLYTKMNKVIIECSECGKYFEVQPVDIERYKEVRALGHPSIMLDCRLCNQRTYWAVLSEVHTSWDSVPDKEGDSIWLPENLTLTIDEYMEQFPLHKQSDILIGGEQIALYNRATAQELVHLSEQKTWNVFQVRLINAMYQEFNGSMPRNTIDIANTSIVLGSGDGVYLIVSDKDLFGNLYLYYDDGGIITPTSKTLRDIRV